MLTPSFAPLDNSVAPYVPNLPLTLPLNLPPNLQEQQLKLAHQEALALKDQELEHLCTDLAVAQAGNTNSSNEISILQQKEGMYTQEKEMLAVCTTIGIHTGQTKSAIGIRWVGRGAHT